MAFVSGTFATTTTKTGTFTLGVTKSVTAGNTLLVYVNDQSSTATAPLSGHLTSIDDNGSNTYAPAVGTAGYSATATIPGGGSRDWLAYCQTITNTQSLTVTAHFAIGALTAAFVSVLIVEYSNLGLFDVNGAMTNQTTSVASGTNTITSGTVSVPAGDTVIGICINWTGNATFTTGTGFAADYVDATPATYRTESLTQASTTTRGATFSTAVSTDWFITGMLAFKPKIIWIPDRAFIPSPQPFIAVGGSPT